MVLHIAMTQRHRCAVASVLRPWLDDLARWINYRILNEATEKTKMEIRVMYVAAPLV